MGKEVEELNFRWRYLLMTMKSWSTFVVKLSMSLNITTTGGDCQCLEAEVLFLLGVLESVFYKAIHYALIKRW